MPEPPAPDNRAAWNAISAAYQARFRLPSDRLTWGVWCPDEEELRLLGDVRGQRVLVLGCGGGQDCVALARMGATEVTGIDLSDAQIAYARRLLDDHGVTARLLQGSVEDLSAIASASQDLALSAHALNYVEGIDQCFAEAWRVLVPGGRLVFSVQHPLDIMTTDAPPYRVERSYFQVQDDWAWAYPEAGVRGVFRSWYRPVSAWFQALVGAGFIVDRVLEPPPPEREPVNGFEERDSVEKARMIPLTLLFRAYKPGNTA